MYVFKSLTPTNGFDIQNLNNARQNNYAWSMAELDGYIYVGTGRNVLVTVLQSLAPGIKLPSLIKPDPQDNLAEIWRYKKDGSLPWTRVYKAPVGSGIVGFRYMLSDKPENGSPCLFAATFGTQVKVLKSTNGVNWFETLGGLEGTSSRAMVSWNGKVYISTVNEASEEEESLLYKSDDPEFYPWESIINPTEVDFDPAKNPQGGISNMVVFNNKLYVGTSSSKGAQVWRSNTSEPKMNEWTLIVDNGFGDKANKYVLSMGVFKNHVYVSGTKPLPLAWAVPLGCDIIRIDKYDRWQLVVGGPALDPSTPTNGVRGKSLSGLWSGFNNPFNVYAWQIQEHNGKLLISTFDDSSNMEVILTTILANKAAVIGLIGEELTEILIIAYKLVVTLLAKFKYPIGFDLFVSDDGIHFNRIVKSGLNNPDNYGGRILFVDSEDKLYLGTANPFEGCEVWLAKEVCSTNSKPENRYLMPCHEDLLKEIEEHFTLLKDKLPLVMKDLSVKTFHDFIENK